MTNNQENRTDHGNGMAWRRKRPSIIRPRRLNGKILIAGDTFAARHQEEAINLDWCSSWLSSRLINLPAPVASLHTLDKSVRDMAAFDSVCSHVESYVHRNRSCGINDMAEHLQALEVFEENNDDDEAFKAMRLPVYSAL